MSRQAKITEIRFAMSKLPALSTEWNRLNGQLVRLMTSRR